MMFFYFIYTWKSESLTIWQLSDRLSMVDKLNVTCMAVRNTAAIGLSGACYRDDDPDHGTRAGRILMTSHCRSSDVYHLPSPVGALGTLYVKFTGWRDRVFLLPSFRGKGWPMRFVRKRARMQRGVCSMTVS
jgi:hypothetical protein